MKKETKIIGTGMVTALAASSCCITPFLALLTGSSSLVSTFSWLEPARPYFIGFTVLTLGYAWFHHFKSSRPDACGCDAPKKKNFMQRSSFLVFLTLFSGLMLAFPLYSSLFYASKPQKEVVLANPENLQHIAFTVEGMTCEACSQHIHQEINQLPGIVQAAVSYPNHKATIAFDSTKITTAEIENTIRALGYTTTPIEK